MEVKTLKGLFIGFIANVASKAMRSKLKTIVTIEGGFGSQLIGLLIYEVKKRDNPKVRPNVSYFTHQRNITSQSEVSIWKWELDKYGYYLNNFSSQSKFYDRFISVVNSKRSDKDKSDLNSFVEIPWRTHAKQMSIAEDLDSYLQKYELTIRDDFSVIHIRRGDYLKVSSRVVKLEDSIEIYKRLIAQVTSPIFIASDDKLGKEDLECIDKYFVGARIIIVEPNTNLHLVHSLMRSASILVTSNSTFSWTAGMLNVRKKPIIISPTTFFGDTDNQSDDLFQTSSSWMVLDVD